MDIDEREAMREEMLKDQHHERQMRNDVEYFCRYVTENFYLPPDQYKESQGFCLIPVIEILEKFCDDYEQSFDDLLNYIKDI